MEYTLIDLFRILKKRWYVVLAIAAVFGCGAIPLSRASYQQALDDYKKFTDLSSAEEQIVSSNSVFTLRVDYRFAIEDANAWLEQARQKDLFVSDFLKQFGLKSESSVLKEADAYSFAVVAYNDTLDKFQKYLLGDKTYDNVPSELHEICAESGLTPQDCFVVTMMDPENYFWLTVNYLPEQDSIEAAKLYLKSIEENCLSRYNMNVEFQWGEQSYVVLPNEEQTALASKESFNKTIFKEPPQLTTSYIKIMGTAIVFGLAAGCFLLLLVTMLRESRTVEKKKEAVVEADE